VAGSLWGPDIAPLLEKLVLGREEYFSRGRLNTEGRKVFEEAARMIVYEHPYYKGYVTRARRSGSEEDVFRVAELVLGKARLRALLLARYLAPYREPVDELLEEAFLSAL